MKTMTITQADYIKANKIGNRNAELENATGFVSKHKVHKNTRHLHLIIHKPLYYLRSIPPNTTS